MRRVSLALLCSVVFAASAAAQSNVEVNAGVQFDFLSPGARSMAMGGAFIGMADDATAAFVNPAGLRAISRREVSFEGRARDFTIPVAVRGRFGGAPTNFGVDTISNLVDEEQSQNSAGVSFLSFVYPRSRWAIAGYRHELANFESTVQTEGPFFTRPAGNTLNFRRFPIRGAMELDIVTYGISGSFNVTPQFSVGVGVAYHDFKMDSRTDRYAINNAPFTNPVFFGAANFDSANLVNYQLQEGDDSGVGVNVGTLWAPNRMFQVGAVYRQGPDFDLRVANLPARPNDFIPFEAGGQFHVPHVFGVGAVVRPMANGTITVDVTRVEYGRLAEDFVDIFDEEPEGSYFIQDATEVHAGFEYVLPRRIPLALRGGYWFDPEHTLEYGGAGEFADVNRAIYRRRGEDQHHITAGGGAVFGRFEINGAGDFASRATTISFSAVVRF